MSDEIPALEAVQLTINDTEAVTNSETVEEPVSTATATADVAVKARQDKLHKKNRQRAESLKKQSAIKDETRSAAQAADKQKPKTNKLRKKILERLDKMQRNAELKKTAASEKAKKPKAYSPNRRSVVWKDERYKYTAMYYFKPFIIKLSIFITYFLAFQMWNFWKVFTEFSILRLVIIVLFAALCFLCYPNFRDFTKIFLYINKVQQHLNEMSKGRVVTVEGEPGTGKTTLIHYDGYHLAHYVWKDMQVVYYKTLNKYRQNNYKFKDKNERFRWEDFKYSYFFMKKNEHRFIPLLFENTPVREKEEFGGRYSYKLNREHFLQEERLPECAVLVEDESADDLGHDLNHEKLNKKSRGGFKTEEEKRIEEELKAQYVSEKKKINEFMSKLRHFLDAYVYFAEQDAAENFVGLRRVTYKNIYLFGLEMVLEPERYLRIIEKLNHKILRAKGKVKDALYLKLNRLETAVKKIGFMRLNFEARGSIVKSKKVTGNGYIVLPKNQPIEFETRSFFFDYKARNMPLKCTSWNTLYKSSYKKRAFKAQSSRLKAAQKNKEVKKAV